MMNSEKNYYAEKLNIDLFVRILFLSRGKSKIYILDSIDFFDHNSEKKSFFEKLSLKIFKNITIIHVPLYKEAPISKNEEDICWVVNKKCLELIESNYFLQRINFVSKLLVKVSKDSNILIALKKHLLPFIFRKTLFYYQFKQFNQQGINIDKVYVNNTDFLQISKYLNIEINNNMTSNWYAKTKGFLVLLFYGFCSPLIIREVLKRGIIFFKPKFKTFDTALHIVWGFNTSKTFERAEIKQRTIYDDEILKSKILNPKKMIFVGGKIKHGRFLSKDHQNEEIKHINKLGASYIDQTKLKIPLLMLFNKFIGKGILIFSLIVMIKSIIRKTNSHILIYAIQKVFISYLEDDVFCSYVRAKVFISKDDYDPGHITRTIVQNKYNLINVGIQHSGFNKPEYLPFMAHVYFDRYYTAGSGYQKLWFPFWNTNKVVIPVGPQRDHCIFNAQKDFLLEKKFREKYNKQICLVMMITKPNNVFSPTWLMKRKYKGIHELVKIDNGLHVILKPRTADAIKLWIEMFPELASQINNGRISIETNDFTTQELIAFADIFVAEDASSALIEAAYLNKLFKISLNVRYPAFDKLKGVATEDMKELTKIIFDYIKTQEIPKDIDKAFTDIKNNFSLKPTDSSWARMAKDINQIL